MEVFPEDLIFRLGGDEFVVLAKIKGKPDLQAVGSRIVKAISKPLSINGTTVDLGASIGYTIAESAAQILQMPSSKPTARCTRPRRGGATTLLPLLLPCLKNSASGCSLNLSFAMRCDED